MKVVILIFEDVKAGTRGLQMERFALISRFDTCSRDWGLPVDWKARGSATHVDDLGVRQKQRPLVVCFMISLPDSVKVTGTGKVKNKSDCSNQSNQGSFGRCLHSIPTLFEFVLS